MDISDGTLFEDVCRYSCDAGYMLVGPANRTCQADGQWSGSERICESEALKLMSNSIYVHFVHFATCIFYSFMYANVACDSVYVANSFLCTCAISAGVSCGQLDTPSNGHVNTSAGTSFMDVARYSCVEGYVLSGRAERTCQADQQWSGRVPACESEMLQCM